MPMNMQATTLKSPVNQNRRVPYQQRLNTLQSEIYLTLQTRHAQALVRGRNVPGKPLIVGLVGFADRLRLIWTGAKQNDPYADWWLIKIEDAINATSNSLQNSHTEVSTKLNEIQAIRIAPAASKDPFRFELRFATPYAFRAASTLAQFDALTRDALTARHTGLITGEESQDLIFRFSHKIRSILNLPFSYRYLSIDRARPDSWKDVQSKAQRLMGVLPEDVRSGKRRAPLAPDICVNTEMDLPAVEDPAMEEVLGC